MLRPILLLLLCGLSSQKVIATLSTPALQPSASQSECNIKVNNKNIDYGQVSRWQLEKADGASGLLTHGKRIVAADVVCTTAKPLQISVEGRRNEYGNFLYGRKGTLKLSLISLTVNGEAALPDEITSPFPQKENLSMPQKIMPGDVIVVGKKNPVTQMTLQFEVEPLLTGSELNVPQRTENQGGFILTLRTSTP